VRIIQNRVTFICFVKSIFTKTKLKDYKNIPIIINNRNHYDYLLKLISFLEKHSYNNIIILDNDSTYPKLLEYYQKCPYRIIFLSKNIGHMALNECDLWYNVRNDYFVYTDPDVVPTEDCPGDFLEYFMKTLKKNPFIQKTGFSLKIDDLPECYEKKKKVIDWEAQFWTKKTRDGNYIAPIDTTFALHRPGIKVSFSGLYIKHYRTGYPYQARHLPWYEDSNNLSDNILYYYQYAKKSNNW
jgi:hypothetical protein